MATPKKKPTPAAKVAAPAKKAAPAAKAAAPAKKAAPAAKAAAPAKKAAPAAKAAAPAKKAAPATKAAAPAKKAAPATKAVAPAKKAAPAAKAAAPAKKAAPATKAAAPAKKAAPATKAAAPAKKEPGKKTTPGKSKGDNLTAEEKLRVVKLKATLALLKADREWPAFLAAQKKMLMEMRDHLLPNMQNVTRDHLRSGASNVSSASGQHIGDAGSEAEVRDLTIRLLDKDREQLFQIDDALERIRTGTYGICEMSLEPIPKKRLQVLPFCRLTVQCQEEYEKKYGSFATFGTSKTGNVGFSGLQNVMENVISLDEPEE